MIVEFTLCTLWLGIFCYVWYLKYVLWRLEGFVDRLNEQARLHGLLEAVRPQCLTMELLVWLSKLLVQDQQRDDHFIPQLLPQEYRKESTCRNLASYWTRVCDQHSALWRVLAVGLQTQTLCTGFRQRRGRLLPVSGLRQPQNANIFAEKTDCECSRGYNT